MLFKRLALRSAAVFLASPLSLSASAQTFQLLDNEWELLSVPGDVSGISISTLFGDELVVTDYDTDSTEGTWRIWQYDSVSGTYVDPGVNGALNPDSAFWIIQATGDTVTLDVSEIDRMQATASSECANSAGCLSIPVPTNSSTFTWSMLGSPFSCSTPYDDSRFKTALSQIPCFDGCSMQEASDVPLVYTVNNVWVYDNSLPIPDYRKISAGEVIPTWKGFWFLALENASGTSPQLLVPDTSTVGSILVRVTTPEGAPIENVSVSQVGGGISGLTDSEGLAEL